jgi:hypothetical protein
MPKRRPSPGHSLEEHLELPLPSEPPSIAPAMLRPRASLQSKFAVAEAHRERVAGVEDALLMAREMGIPSAASSNLRPPLAAILVFQFSSYRRSELRTDGGRGRSPVIISHMGETPDHQLFSNRAACHEPGVLSPRESDQIRCEQMGLASQAPSRIGGNRRWRHLRLDLKSKTAVRAAAETTP